MIRRRVSFGNDVARLYLVDDTEEIRETVGRELDEHIDVACKPAGA